MNKYCGCPSVIQTGHRATEIETKIKGRDCLKQEETAEEGAADSSRGLRRGSEEREEAGAEADRKESTGRAAACILPHGRSAKRREASPSRRGDEWGRTQGTKTA